MKKKKIQSTNIFNEKPFEKSLANRIQTLRSSFKKTGPFYHEGSCFKNDVFLVDAVMGAVLDNSKRMKMKNVSILAYAVGLSFDESFVNLGKYDDLIRHVLGQAAHFDFVSQNNLDIH